MNFKTVRTYFLSDVFGLLSSRNFATVATSRSDFSSLLAVNFNSCTITKHFTLQIRIIQRVIKLHNCFHLSLLLGYADAIIVTML